MRQIVFAAALALLVFHSTVLAADFYVSPQGSDQNPGTGENPFATLAAARDAVRRRIANGMQENITVHLAAGRYFVPVHAYVGERRGCCPINRAWPVT